MYNSPRSGKSHIKIVDHHKQLNSLLANLDIQTYYAYTSIYVHVSSHAMVMGLSGYQFIRLLNYRIMDLLAVAQTQN